MKTKFMSKRKSLSKGWEKIITEGSKTPPRIIYKKDKDKGWLYRYLGWNKK